MRWIKCRGKVAGRSSRGSPGNRDTLGMDTEEHNRRASRTVYSYKGNVSTRRKLGNPSLCESVQPPARSACFFSI